MMRVLTGVGLLAPSALLLFFWRVPEADWAARLPLLHFYIVTFTTFAAVVLSILLSLALEEGGQTRHLLAAVAFAAMGTIFFSHGLATPEALIHEGHPAIRWSAWLTLLAGSVLFLAATLHDPARAPAWLSVRRIVYAASGLIALYLLVALLAPDWLAEMNAEAGPTERFAIFGLTLLLWLIAAWRFARLWQRTRSPVDGALAFVAFWLANGAISMHRFPAWNVSWWMYHFLLLISFLVATAILVAAYEQTRQFRLLHYYIAASLIVTALLALVASDLFSRFSYQTSVAQVERASTEMLTTLTETVSTTLPDGSTAAAIRDAVADQVRERELGNVVVYDDAERIVYPEADTRYPDLLSPDYRVPYRAALAGTPQIYVVTPQEAAGEYGISGDAPLVSTLVPIPGQGVGARPVGVLFLIRPSPELHEATLRSRRAGLGITGLTMTVLFMALLLVVRRANSIIAARTAELSRTKRQSDELLLNILPAHVAEELKETGRVQPVNYELATVMFTDFQNFTRIAATLTPEVLVSELDECFSHFDRIIRTHRLEKLKTVGDGYMCAGGIPTGSRSDACDVVRAALDIQAFMAQRMAQKQESQQPYWGIRIGIHSGPLVAGVIGREKFAYDVWGDTVNTAHRLEEACEPGKINISGATYALVQDSFHCEYRGKIAVKSKQPLDMYFVTGQNEGAKFEGLKFEG